MDENIYSRLKRSSIIPVAIWGFIALFYTLIVYDSFTESSTTTGTSFFAIVFTLSIGALVYYLLIKNVIYFINPNKNPTALKYGGIEELEKIVKEINNTIIYNDVEIIISKNYISELKNYKKITHLDDVINAFQYVQKTNGIVTKRDLVIVNKNGDEIHFFVRNNEQKILEILKILSTVRNDIQIGYKRS